MAFNLETTDMDLGNTPIENIFINDYMPMANGTYVKVYLLGYKYAFDKDAKIELTNQTISKHLDIPLEDVLRAWDFWESKGIIKKMGTNDINYDVEFLNLKQLFIRNNIMPKTETATTAKENTSWSDDLVSALRNPVINEMFNRIDETVRRQTQPTEKKRILSWFYDYNMDPDVIEKAFQYGYDVRNKKSINYVEGIVRNWYDMGLTTMDAVIEQLSKEDLKYHRYLKVMKAVGLSHKGINDGDMKLITKWFDEYDFSMELVLKGCEASSKIQFPTINYIDGVMRDWHKKGIKTVEDIEILDKPAEKKSQRTEYKPKSRISYKTKFHNFEQRSSKYSASELEELARKKREAHRVKGMGEADE
ncbi:MAG: DnaD domain protein [Gudongella sp.]|jgi:DnaD/phage-associated family protein|nr:DnaD domain protein [Gudongella sp.]